MTSLPQLWGVLYAAPNANGERKACSNCRFFEGESPARALLGSGGTKCEILPVPVSPEMVCGYHIEQLADPGLAGLETVPGGTSCDTCAYYNEGLCMATEGEDGGPAQVEPMGCCARWEGTTPDPGSTDGMGY